MKTANIKKVAVVATGAALLAGAVFAPSEPVRIDWVGFILAIPSAIQFLISGVMMVLMLLGLAILPFAIQEAIKK